MPFMNHKNELSSIINSLNRCISDILNSRLPLYTPLGYVSILISFITLIFSFVAIIIVASLNTPSIDKILTAIVIIGVITGAVILATYKYIL